MDVILKGIVTGFILSIMVGPVFFVLLETSIRKGIKDAVAFDIGVLLNDIVYIGIAYFFYNQVEQLSEGNDNSILRLIGGSLFLAYGIYSFFKKTEKMSSDVELQAAGNFKGYAFLALKGFLLNLANPMVVFYWFSVMTLGLKDTSAEQSNQDMLIFLGTILLTFFSIDFLKILGAKSLRSLVTQNFLTTLNRIIGVIFVGFGVVLIAQGLIGLVQ